MSDVNTRHFPLGDILIVDDTQSDLKLLSGILRKAGYRVRPASDGELALRSVQAKLPDLVLLDINMPDLDGYEVCRRLKGSENTMDVPVIFISVEASTIEKVKAFGLSCVDYITKPFEPEEVLARVATHLALWRTQKEIREKNKQLQQEITERKRAEKRIEHLNQVLRAIRNVNQLIAREKGRDRLLKGTCDNLVQTRGYYNAWIALLDEKRDVVTTAESGLGKDFFPMADLLKAGTLTDCGQKALGQAEVVVTKDPRSTCTDCPLSDQYRGRGAMTVGLEHEGKLYGLLSASISKDFLEDQEERFLFQDIARDIAFALHDKELEEERKKAQDALWESEEKYRTILEGIEESYWEVDLAGNLSFFNDSTCRILGYTKDELIGINNRQFMDTENAKKVYQTFSEVYGTGKPTKGFDWEITRKDGTKIYVETSVSLRKDSKGHPIGFRGIAKDITERKRAEKNLTASLKEKELLLQEINHRVKNNMQVISSLLKLQAETIKDERFRAPFRDAEHRVRAMSLVHEKLYQSKDFTHVPFRDYLQSLIRYLYQSYTPPAGTIELVTEIEDLSLDINTAIPCGLVINELISNSMKHAFPEERKGTITISLHSPAENTIDLTVSDDGIGLPEAIDPHTTTSLGLNLVSILVEDQLKGEIEVERTGGTRVRIRFRTQQ